MLEEIGEEEGEEEVSSPLSEVVTEFAYIIHYTLETAIIFNFLTFSRVRI